MAVPQIILKKTRLKQEIDSCAIQIRVKTPVKYL